MRTVARILLVQPPLPEVYAGLVPESFYWPPLSLGYLASALIAAGHEAVILDLHPLGASLDEESLRGHLRSGYDVIGVSSTTPSYSQALRIVRVAKEVLPDCTTVAGGSHVTFMAKEALAEEPVLDIVVLGEGESTLVDITDAVGRGTSPRGILGTAIWNHGRVDVQPPRPPAPINQIRPPARWLLEAERYPSEGVLASRGCPARCIFCAAGAMSSGAYRVRRIRDICDELSQFDGAKKVSLYDNTFGGNKAWAKSFCHEVTQRGINLQWTAETRANLVSPELLQDMAEAGCTGLQLGVESGSQAVLDSMGKGITVSQAVSAAKAAFDCGVKDVACSFSIGHPRDTEETVAETFRMMERLKAMGVRLALAIVTPFPGTPIASDPERYGLTIHDRNWDTYYLARPVMSTSNLTKDRIGQLFMYAMANIV